MLWGKWSDEDVDEYVISSECFLSWYFKMDVD